MRRVCITDEVLVCRPIWLWLLTLEFVEPRRHPCLGDSLRGSLCSRLEGRPIRCLEGDTDRNGPSDSACSLPDRAAGRGFRSSGGSQAGYLSGSGRSNRLCCRLRCLPRSSDGDFADSSAGRCQSCSVGCFMVCFARCCPRRARSCRVGGQSRSLFADHRRSSQTAWVPLPTPARAFVAGA